jgi:hypothetical protein
MRKLIGYLVACRGDEVAAVRMAAGILQQFLCKEDRADRVHARIDDDSIGAGFAIGKTASPPTGSSVTNTYSRKNFTLDVVGDIPNPVPGFSVSD